MSVITISRGSFSHGQEVAERTAKRLGYDCISREILIAASKDFNISEINLFQAIHDAPTFMDRILLRKEKYIAYIQAAVLKTLQKGNVVYHGFAGHFFVKDISHVLKVRIIADMEERMRIVTERNGLSRDAATAYIQKLDEQRRKWSQQLYGIETADPSLYDLVIHIDRITVDDAVDIICHKIGLHHFQATPESRQQLKDLSLAAEVKAALIDLKPDIEVTARTGTVRVTASASSAQQSKLEKEMRKVAETIPGIQNLEIDLLYVASYSVD
ncbi:MAG: cytidylate kinase-like family protein [Desulfobacterales bacterium]|nr:cytidylate kinase-like family protein [Desulfobacterales bacterium]